jgi:hypothetical protein
MYLSLTLLSALIIAVYELPEVKATQNATTNGFSMQFSDNALPSGSPTHTLNLPSALHCGRACLTDPLCQLFAVPRNVAPIGSVSCQIYYQNSTLVYDGTHTTYFTGNNTLPY